MYRGELEPIHFPEAKEIQSECGLAGIFLTEQGIKAGLNVSALAYQAGIDLQHRAEGSAGMMVSDGKRVRSLRDIGRVEVVFEQGKNLPQIKNSKISLIHMRYPTAGGSNHKANIQPFESNGIWLGHHGNLTNAMEIEESIPPKKKSFLSPLLDRRKSETPDSDSWIALSAIVQAKGSSLGEKLVDAQSGFEGGWAFITTDGKTMVVARDPHGIRPLFIGYIGRGRNETLGYVISVESCVFNNLGVRNFREVLPGETVEVDNFGEKTLAVHKKDESSCIFEFVYMMRPNSEFLGKGVYEARRKAGKNLWREAPIKLENGKLLVMPVPNSGRPSALGYFEEARKDLGEDVLYEEGLFAHPYSGRNFIKPTFERDATKKFYTVESVLKGKIVVLVDDSVVRGDTMSVLVKLLRDAGAKEVHVRVSSPEINNPCYWGVAFGTQAELLSSKTRTQSEKEDYLGATSLEHLSLKGLVDAVGIDKSKLCTYCFDKKGPLMPKLGVVPLSEVRIT